MEASWKEDGAVMRVEFGGGRRRREAVWLGEMSVVDERFGRLKEVFRGAPPTVLRAFASRATL